MQDRCLGLYFDFPLIKFKAVDPAGNPVQRSFSLDDSERVYYHLKAPAASWSIERVTPYLYTAANEPRMKADGKCGQIVYYPACFRAPDLVTWKKTQVNPKPEEPSTADLEFMMYSNKDSDLGADFEFTLDINTNTTQPLYPTRTFNPIIKILPCFVFSASQTNYRMPDFFLPVLSSTQKFAIQPFLQDPACKYNITYSVTFRNITGFDEAVDFYSLLL